jgi:hypothetical protein
MSDDPIEPATASGFSVLNALNRHVEREYEEREPDGFWHPSSLFGCLRQAIYSSRGTEITNQRDDRSRRVLRVGHILHDFVQAAVEAHPGIARAYSEAKIQDDELKIRGSLDQVLVFDDGRVEVAEYKTINSQAFKYRDLPKPDHVGQLSVYLMVLKNQGAIAGDGTVIPPSVARGRIAYVSKDDLLIDEYTVLLSEGKERAILRRVGYLDLYAADGEALPPRLPDEIKKGERKRAYLCNYCPYAQRCWETDGPGVNLLGEEIL